MGTEAQAREWRKWLGKELYASQLAEHRRNLDTIATDIKEERKARKKSLREAKATCKASFAALKDRAREAVTNARTVAIEARREEKQAQREQCKLDRDHIKANIKANLQELAKNRQALHAAKSECKARAVAVKQRADEAHAKAIALEADAQRAKKRAHLDRCKLDREHIKTEAAAKIAANEKKAGELKPRSAQKAQHGRGVQRVTMKCGRTSIAATSRYSSGSRGPSRPTLARVALKRFLSMLKPIHRKRSKPRKAMLSSSSRPTSGARTENAAQRPPQLSRFEPERIPFNASHQDQP